MNKMKVAGCSTCPLSGYNGRYDRCLHPSVPRKHQDDALPGETKTMVDGVMHFSNGPAPGWCPLPDNPVEVVRS